MNVVFVGGSSHSSPALFDCTPSLDRAIRVTLCGRDPARLAAVARACDLLGDTHGIPGVATAPFERLRRAVRDAGVVVVQIRAGGYAARAWDERFPHAYELCGDEGLGAGGLASAWRTWPHVREILAIVASEAPGALVVMLTSPVGILTRAALDEFPDVRIAGLCELPWTTLRDALTASGADVEGAEFTYAGVNHLGWFSQIRDRRGRELAAMPLALSYVRLHAEPARILAEQRASTPRASTLDAMAQDAFACYARDDAAAIAQTLRKRATPWYADALVPLLNALVRRDRAAMPFFLTGRNRGYLPWIGADDVVEIPHRCRDGVLEPDTPIAAFPDGLAATIARLVAYERAATAAVRARDAAALGSALRAHPWLDGKPVSGALLRDLLAAEPAAAATGPR